MSNSDSVFRIFFEDFDLDITECDIWDIFQEYGRVLSVNLCCTIDGHSLGYGFVKFSRKSEAKKAIKDMDLCVFSGSCCRVSWARSNTTENRNKGVKVFIKKLDPSIREQEWKLLFEQSGAILSLDLYKDQSGNYTGCGCVEFNSSEEAATSIRKYNGKKIGRSSVEVTDFLTKNEMKNQNQSNKSVYVKNFGTLLDNAKLKKIFERFGKVISTNVIMNGNGTSRGFGFVNFNDENDARKAIKKLNGTYLNDQKLFVGKTAQNETRVSKVPNSNTQQNQRKEACVQERNTSTRNKIPEDVFQNFTICWVKYFGPSLSDADLVEMFQPFGDVINTKVIYNEYGESKNFAFVEFNEHSEALAAIKCLNGKMRMGRKVLVSPSLSRDERELYTFGSNLYVNNLNKSIDDEGLRYIFSQFGLIVSAKVMTKSNKKDSLGYGFVSFSVQEDAEEAISEMDGATVEGKALYVTRARPKNFQINQNQIKSTSDWKKKSFTSTDKFESSTIGRIQNQSKNQFNPFSNHYVKNSDKESMRLHKTTTTPSAINNKETKELYFFHDVTPHNSPKARSKKFPPNSDRNGCQQSLLKRQSSRLANVNHLNTGSFYFSYLGNMSQNSDSN